MQATYEPVIGPKPPQGGFYEIAIDIEAVGKNKTKATIYIGRTGHGEVVQAFKSWMQGRNVECPITKHAEPKQG
jgi:hypothetical protein